MSLNTMLKDPAVLEMFRKTFPIRNENIDVKLKAAPVTRNYGLVGTAFDYLFRWKLELINPHAISRTWVAEHGVGRLQDPDKLESLFGFIESAKKVYSDYLHYGIITNSVLETVTKLAKLDFIIRANIVDDDFDKIDSSDVEDLRNLAWNIESNYFKSSDVCILNPTFGKGSLLVGGADADVIIDNNLIDIKVTKIKKVKPEYIYQLLGYYILLLYGSVDGVKSKLKIDNLSLYFARHGFLYSIPIPTSDKATLIKTSKNEFDKFYDWFVRTAKNKFT